MVRYLSGLLFAFAIFSVTQCTHTEDTKNYSFYQNKNANSRIGKSAFGKSGVVTTAHPLATKAGIDMLKKGGNAIDGMVAASFAISVLRPQSTGIGGGGFLVYYDQKIKKSKVYDFRERAPEKATVSMYLDKDGTVKDFIYNKNTIKKPSQNGHLAVGVPGLVAGLVDVHKKSGKLSLAEVMKPAIELAEKGFPVYESLTKAIERRKVILSHFEDSKRIFLPYGRALQPGTTLFQKDLAKTLKAIAKNGKDGFYKGAVAKAIVAEMKKGRGLITQKDLDHYQVKEKKPLLGTYKGYKIASMPPPSSGGAHIIQMLNMLEKDNLSERPRLSAENIHLVTEVMRRAFADRAEYLGDEEFVKVPTSGIINKKYAKDLRKGIKTDKASTSKEVGAGNPVPYESSSTTHISILDQWGNGASTTQTVNYTFGSGVVARGTGVVLNNEMDDFSIKPGVPNAYGLIGSKANAIAAKKTMLSSMSPTLVFDKNNKLVLIVGSPGGPRIINATFHTILNFIEYKMNLADAVHASRFHHQWMPDQIRIEDKGPIDPAVIAKLKSMGHKIKVGLFPIGDVQAIGRYKSGWIGVSDTRSDGIPMAY